MSLADEIRAMSDEELARFLVWDAPDECDNCEGFGNGCAYSCSYNKRTERMLEILQKED